MNKKLLSVLVCVLLVLVAIFVVSCGGDNTDTSTNTNTNADTSTNTDTSSDTSTDTEDQKPVTPTECTVVFVLNNGTEDVIEVVKYNDVVRRIPRNPAKTGYEFKGWLCEGKSWVPGAITTDMTIVADWKPNNNNLAFIPNGAENTMDPVVIPSDTTVALNACTLVKTGYDFLGWATKMGGEVVYADGADFTMGINKYNSLYAVWAPANYSITYELNGGTNAETNPDSYTIESVVTFADPSKEGYTFEGWTVNGEKIESTKNLLGDITLVANFELVRYNINYVNMGNATNNNPTSFNVEDEVVLSTPIRDGYDFLGWFMDEELTVPFEKIPLGTEEDVTVYASFKILPFKITYELPIGLTNSDDNISEYTVETEFTFIAPTVSTTGYAFTGWYIKGTDTKLEALVPGENEGSLTLEARTTLIIYKITYATEGESMPSDAITSYTINDRGTYVLPTLSKFGYEFGGWFTSHPYEGLWENPISEIVIDPENPSDIVAYAKFTLANYTINYVYGDLVENYVVANNNPTYYDIVNPVEFVTAYAGEYSVIAWYKDEAKTERIKTTDGLSGDITVYARWAVGDNEPTKLVTLDNISEVYATERSEYATALFDGVKKTGGIYSDNKGEWFATEGQSLTIILNEEMEVQLVYGYAMGNWTISSHVFYDADGNEVFRNEDFVANTSGQPEGEQIVVFEAIEDQQPIKVQKIVITVLSLKWTNDARTHKISEYEIFATNPDYIDPDQL